MPVKLNLEHCQKEMGKRSVFWGSFFLSSGCLWSCLFILRSGCWVAVDEPGRTTARFLDATPVKDGECHLYFIVSFHCVCADCFRSWLSVIVFMKDDSKSLNHSEITHWGKENIYKTNMYLPLLRSVYVPVFKWWII